MHVSTSDLEKALGMTIDGVDHFLVANRGGIFMYDDHTYELKYEISIGLSKSNNVKYLQIVSVSARRDG